MSIVLRMIAVLAGMSVIATLLFIVKFAPVGLQPLIATGALGALTIIGWVVTLLLGTFATVALFRLRNVGRVAAAYLYGYMLGYYAVGLIAFRQHDVPVVPTLLLCAFLAVTVAVLLSSSAKRVCAAAEAGAALIA